MFERKRERFCGIVFLWLECCPFARVQGHKFIPPYPFEEYACFVLSPCPISIGNWLAFSNWCIFCAFFLNPFSEDFWILIVQQWILFYKLFSLSLYFEVGIYSILCSVMHETSSLCCHANWVKYINYEVQTFNLHD